MSATGQPSVIAAPEVELPYSAAQHLRLALFGVVARIIESCTAGDVDAAIEIHPFLAEYLDEMRAHLGSADAGAAAWWRLVCEWEAEAVRREVHLPLAALHAAGLSAIELELLLAVGLVEEDPRFAAVFEHAQREERRPTCALLLAWWRDGGDEDRADDIRRAVQRLIEHGLVHLRNADAPRGEWVLAPALAAWDALRGEPPAAPWIRYQPMDRADALDDLVLPEAVSESCRAMRTVLTASPAPLLIVRGPLHNGRKTLARAIARSLGRPVLVTREAVFDDEGRWRLLGALSAASDAAVVIDWELAPGESRTVPPLALTGAPLIVVTGRHGAWLPADSRAALTIDLPLPSPSDRLRLWRASLPHVAAALPPSAAGMRLSSGSIRAVATAAAAHAQLEGRDSLDPRDLRRGCRTLQSARLETVATRLEAQGSLADLAVDEPTRDELEALVARCRWRETLAAERAAAFDGGVGVRALFAGPSGTGKTLAARLLGAALDKEVYRVDLAATVNKYLGETEKSLNRTLAAAEELDVVLLIDEGDALMARRTDVASSNDRYANLETNFLLQRLESFEGIVVVTTNAAERIDRAFARRMDVVVNFRPPDALRRLEILKLHLRERSLDQAWLEEAASRCALTGGQWRNIVTHARLLALQDARPLDEGHLGAALAREYRKSGGSCPLRPMPVARWP